MAFRVSLREDERGLVHGALLHLADRYHERAAGTISDNGEKFAANHMADQLRAVAAKFAPKAMRQ